MRRGLTALLPATLSWSHPFLYGGYPYKGLRHKFLMAQERDAQELTKEYLPEGFAIIP